MRRFAFPAFLSLVVTAAIAVPRPSSAQRPRGSLFIVGGGARSADLMRRFVELAGGPGARIVVVPMASATPQETGEEQAKELRELGADAESLVLTRVQADDTATALHLEGAGGIWFSGGDQARLVPILRGTVTLRAMQRRYRQGAVVGGTSAGAAVMSDPMLTGNQQKLGEDTVGYYGDTYERIARGYIDLEPGLGFLPDVFVDQHFLRRERHNRLISVVLEHPDRLGVGIDEGTALEVGPDGIWRVRGASAAVVYDARQATVTPPSSPVLGATDIRIHLLPAGSSFDPRTGRATLPRRDD